MEEKHIKLWENWDYSDEITEEDIEMYGDEAYKNTDKYLESFEYFVETYINGQFGQLRNMMTKYQEDKKMGDLFRYIDNESYLGAEKSKDLKNWIYDNMD